MCLHFDNHVIRARIFIPRMVRPGAHGARRVGRSPQCSRYWRGPDWDRSNGSNTTGCRRSEDSVLSYHQLRSLSFCEEGCHVSAARRLGQSNAVCNEGFLHYLRWCHTRTMLIHAASVRSDIVSHGTPNSLRASSPFMAHVDQDRFSGVGGKLDASSPPMFTRPQHSSVISERAWVKTHACLGVITHEPVL
jgi:hypothetical protein